MKIGDIVFLNQLVNTIDQSSIKMEEDYGKGNYEEFNKSKKLILDIVNKISKIIK